MSETLTKTLVITFVTTYGVTDGALYRFFRSLTTPKTVQAERNEIASIAEAQPVLLEQTAQIRAYCLCN